MTSIGQWLSEVRDLPRLDCEILLCESLNVNRARILAFPEDDIPENSEHYLNQQISALRTGLPLAYVLGEREFWGLTFSVNTDVLIPRPETELLVELAIQLTPPNGHVLDLGTGSGAIAVAVAHERPDITMTAVDSSRPALAVARQNADTHNVDVSFIDSDWFSALDQRWDVIVSNPPYVAADDPHLPALRAEPSRALIAADKGMADIRAIITQSASYLSPGGSLMIEHGYDQAAGVREEFSHAGFEKVSSKRDLADIERVTLGSLTSLSSQQTPGP